MTLGNLLANIADTQGNTREQWETEFLKRIAGHREEKLLKACLEKAWQGQKYISLGKHCLPPESLKNEGFYIEKEFSGYKYCFE